MTTLELFPDQECAVAQIAELYLTADQIRKEECFNEANTQAKIAYAEALGEGVQMLNQRKGWYRDKSRQNEPVYYYVRKTDKDLFQSEMKTSKKSKWTMRSTFTHEYSWLTRDQIKKQECFNETNTQALIKYAQAMGEGVNSPGKRKGWYLDESRGNAPVYYYAKSMVHTMEMREAWNKCDSKESLENHVQTPYRPLQYYLLTRPAGMTTEKAKQAWKNMTEEDRSQFGIDTWQDRKERKLTSFRKN